VQPLKLLDYNMNIQHFFSNVKSDVFSEGNRHLALGNSSEQHLSTISRIFFIDTNQKRFYNGKVGDK